MRGWDRAYAGYDNWLVAPYERAAARGEAIDAEIERLGLNAPHAPGDSCPRCGWAGALVENNPAEWMQEPPTTLYCEHCGEQIDQNEDPTFEPDPSEYEGPDPDRMRDELYDR